VNRSYVRATMHHGGLHAYARQASTHETPTGCLPERRDRAGEGYDEVLGLLETLQTEAHAMKNPA